MNVLLLSLLSLCSPPDMVQRIVVPSVTETIVIDGRLDEKAWQSAPLLSGFAIGGSTIPAPVRNEVRLLCDGAFLYTAFVCEEPAIEAVKQALAEFTEANWDTERIEFQFDIPHGQPHYREFMVNPNGFGSVGYALDKEAADAIQSACEYRDSAWVGECALPLKAYGIGALNTQVVWGVNISRFRTYFAPDRDETYQWTGNPFGFRDTSKYAELVLGPETGLIVESLCLGECGAGPENPVYVRLNNLGETQNVSVYTYAGDEKNGTATLLDVKAGVADYTGNLTLQSEPNQQQVILSIVDNATKRPLYTRLDHANLAPPIHVDFISPAYRGLLTPQDKSVDFNVDLGVSPGALRDAEIETAIIQQSRVIQSAKSKVQGKSTAFSFDAAQLKGGSNQLHVAVTNATGEVIASDSLEIRKAGEGGLTHIQGRIDENLRLVVKGEPFFPLGWYSGHSPDHLREIADAGCFNCVLDYGMNHLSFDEIKTYLDTANELGMKIIYCCNDLYPGAEYFSDKSVWSGNREIAEATIRAFRDHPALITWYLNDELPEEKTPELLDYYRMFRDLSPDLPTLLVHFKTQLLRPMGKTTDILGLDNYPVPRAPLTEVSDFIDQGYAAVDGRKPVWMVLQAFAWYQYREPEQPVEGNPRARIPTESELRHGRAPTRDEVRCMTYLSLTHNSKALLYYCYYDLRVLPQYEEMWGWLKEIGAEVKELNPALLSAATIKSSCGDPRIHHLARKVDHEIILMAVNGTAEPGVARVQIEEHRTGRVQVLFEDRYVDILDGIIEDSFEPHEAHVYRLR